jgi:uncharacterized protein YkwD
MRISLTLTLLALSVMAACATDAPPPVQTTSPAPAPPTSPAPAAGFGSVLNNFRQGQGLGTLQRSATLDRASQRHAQDMVSRSYFSHTAVDGPHGTTFAERARTAGCALQAGAENIAFGQRSEAAVFEAWKNSPGHRRNMANKAYTQYGLGRVDNTWVMMLSDGC